MVSKTTGQAPLSLGGLVRATLSLFTNPLTISKKPGLDSNEDETDHPSRTAFQGDTGNLLRADESAPVDDLARLLDTSSCAGNFQSGKMVCEIVLPHSVDAKRIKSGDHIILRTNLITSSVEAPITTLDASIVEVQSGVNGGSVLRIRIDKAVGKDGREIPVEARIVALVSQSSVSEGWQFPAIIVDRFPRTPEDDQRLPGEKELSEDQAHTSPLDSMPDIPVHYKIVCLDKKKKASADPCANLLDARGAYNYKKVTLEPAD